MIKKYNFAVWMAVFGVAIVSACGVLICSETTEQYLMSLLPIVYVCALTASGAFMTFIDRSSPGFMIVNILYFIKCVVYPFLNVLSGTTYQSGNRDTLYAICLEIGEILVIYTVFFIYNRYSNTEKNKFADYSLTQNHLEDGSFVTFAFLIVILLICLFVPGALSRYNFFTVDSLDIIYDKINEVEINGVVDLVVKLARYIAAAYWLGYCYQKYEQKKTVRYIVLAIVIVGLSMMIVRGVSRSDFVIPGACGYFLLIRMFPKKKNLISVILLSCLAIVFFTFTIMRFGEFGSLSNISNTLQAYFACEKNMAISISAKRLYGSEIGFNTFLSDLFGNWAGVGEAFRGYYSISQYFNFVFYGHMYSTDQVVPTIGQAYMQFGFLGTYVYTVLMVLICLFLDKKYRETDKVDFSYLYLYGSIKCAVTVMGNLKIFSTAAFNILFPLLILFWVNERVTIGKRGRT